MVPGWLSGHYRFDEITIDFPALAAAAGARWCQGEIRSLDPSRRQLHLADGSTLDHDVLSLNVGSTLHPPFAEHAHVLPLRPLVMLRDRYEALLKRWTEEPTSSSWVLSAVGGGAAGFESLLAVLARLRTLRPDRVVSASLITRGVSLLPSLAPAARLAAQRALQQAGVTARYGSSWCPQVDQDSDVVLWATGAEAHAWQRDPTRRGALSVDSEGFIQVDEHLRSVSHPHIYATGDCASWPVRTLPKAGVHAVRMAPVLARNLRATLLGVAAAGDLAAHKPQRNVLSLLATANGRAIASRGVLGAEGAWAWRWKDRIDRRFLRQFDLPQPKTSSISPSPLIPEADASCPHSGKNP
jgi:NADH dehydrogenase FAD-containing subunit